MAMLKADLVDQISQLTGKTISSVEKSNIPRGIKQGKKKAFIAEGSRINLSVGTAIN